MLVVDGGNGNMGIFWEPLRLHHSHHYFNLDERSLQLSTMVASPSLYILDQRNNYTIPTYTLHYTHGCMCVCVVEYTFLSFAQFHSVQEVKLSLPTTGDWEISFLCDSFFFVFLWLRADQGLGLLDDFKLYRQGLHAAGHLSCHISK